MGEASVLGEHELLETKDLEEEKDEEEEDTYHYVAVVAEQGRRILMQPADTNHLTLHTFKSGPITPYVAAEYRSMLCRRLGISAHAHTHVVEEQTFRFETISLIIVEVTTGECSISTPYVWVDWNEACDEFEKTSCLSAVPVFLRAFLSQHDIETVRNKVKPWYSLGYYDRVFPWIEQAVREAGRKMIGRPEQCHFSERSVAYRIPTESGRLFYKASLRGIGEALRTQKIIELFPQHTAKLLNVSLELEATLTCDFGPTLGDTCFVAACEKPAAGYTDCVAIAESVLQQWANFQKLSAAHVEKLIDGGVPVHNEEWIRAGLEDVLLYLKENGCLSAEEQERLKACKSHLERTFDLWEESGIPMTLVHGDLCALNVAQPNGPASDFVFFDWDFSFIGYPFMDMQDREFYPNFKGESAYLESWAEFDHPETIRRLSAWSKPLVELVHAIVEMRRSYVFPEEEKKSVVAFHAKEFVEWVHNLP